jgi:hypothetical protein
VVLEVVCDRTVGLAAGVLVDERGGDRAVSHSRHQIPGAHLAGGRKPVPGVAQVVEMQSEHPDRGDGLLPVVIEVGWRARQLLATHQSFGNLWWILISLDLAIRRTGA